MNHATPLLLLPGLMNDARIWNPLMTAIAAERTVHIAPTQLHDSVVGSAVCDQ